MNNATAAVAFGPQMPGWGSWEWVGEDVARELSKYYRMTTYPPGIVPNAEVIVVVKQVPDREWLDRVRQRAAVIFAPVDWYGSAGEIDADGALLRDCARVVVHCDELRRYFEPYAPTVYMDHHVKYGVRQLAKQRRDGFILWMGVRTNVPAVVAWVNQHPLPGELVVFTAPENEQAPPTAKDLGFHDDRCVRIEPWTRDRQTRLMASAGAALDIKGHDFRSRHKPPTKAMDYLAAGLPLAMNADSSVVRHLAGMGFNVPSPLDAERWLSREYFEETQRFGAAIRELLSLERVGNRWRKIIDEVLAERR